MGLIRVTLAFAVLLTHLPVATFKFMSGGLAVQGFFIVSGFYMALVLDGKYDDRALFWSNRLLRLLPTYFVMMALYAAALFGYSLSATATPELFSQVYSNGAIAPVLIFENLAVVGQELLFWFKLGVDGFTLDPTGAPPTDAAPVAWQALLVPQSWSLSMELVFYALAPFLARLGWRPLAFIAAASILLRFAGHLLPVDYGLWQGRLFPTALFLFLFGMLAYRALPKASLAPRPVRGLIAAGTLALIVWQPRLGLPDEAGRWLVYAAITAATPFVFSAFEDNAIDRWIGELSYPMYLCHLLVVALVLAWEPAFAAWVAIGITFALSGLLLAIEQPVERWRQARARHAAESRLELSISAAIAPEERIAPR